MTSRHVHDKNGIACNHVMRGKRPLVMIAHDRDGIWQFMCGKDDHSKQKQAKKVCAACMFTKVVKGIEQTGISAGQIAERGADGWAVRDLNEKESAQIHDPSGDGGGYPR